MLNMESGLTDFLHWHLHLHVKNETGVQFPPILWQSNLIETASTTRTTWYSETNWFSYRDVMRIIARIDSVSFIKFDALWKVFEICRVVLEVQIFAYIL